MLKIGLMIFVILLSSVQYAYQVTPVCQAQPRECYLRHEEILTHTAPSPYRYRLLAPMLAQMLADEPTQRGVLVAYQLFHLLVFAALFPGLYLWLKRWGGEDKALLGVLILAVVLPWMFRQYALSPWAALEVALLCWGLWCLSSMPFSRA